MAFLPRDAMETMVAGQCVMFDCLLRDATSDLLRSEAQPVKRRIRSQVIALGRSFLKQLEQLRLLQARQAQQTTASADAERELPPNPNQQSAEAFHPVSAVAEAPPVPVQAPPRSTSVDPASAAPEPPPSGKAGLLQQHGFQNRRTRRALRFKTPANRQGTKGPSQSSAGLAVAPPSAAGAAPSRG
jgi:hypothetical protein